MRRNSFNRKLRRALAASLGAFAFASSAYVTEAAEDAKMTKARLYYEISSFFGNLHEADLDILNAHSGDANNAITDINNKNITINQKKFTLSPPQGHPGGDTKAEILIDNNKTGLFVRLKQGISTNNGVGLSEYNITERRLCPDIDKKLDIKRGKKKKGAQKFANKKAREFWLLVAKKSKTWINDCEQKLEKEKEKQRLAKLAAEKEENQNNNNYSSYFSSAGSNNYNNPISSFNPIVGLASFATTALPVMTNLGSAGVTPIAPTATIQTPVNQVNAGTPTVATSNITTPVGPQAGTTNVGTQNVTAQGTATQQTQANSNVNHGNVVTKGGSSKNSVSSVEKLTR